MILSSFWYHSGILGFLHVKFIADFRTMVKACSGHQFGLCRQFTYRTIILPTVYLWVFVSHRQDNLADWLPLAEFAYNNKVHSATCWTLFELDTGQHLCLRSDPMRTS